MIASVVLSACLVLHATAFSLPQNHFPEPNSFFSFGGNPFPTEAPPVVEEDVTPAPETNLYMRWIRNIDRVPKCDGKCLAEKCRYLPELEVPVKCTVPRFGRTRDCPALSCRQIYELNQMVNVEDGVYFLHIQYKREREVVFPAFCLMSKGGYTMVTKIPSYANMSDAYDFWRKESEVNEGYRSLLQLDMPEHEPVVPYKNRLVRHWRDALDWHEAMVALIKNGKIAQYMSFKLDGTTSNSWFAKERLMSSSWTDLTPTTRTIFFNMAGPVAHRLDRTFVVSHDFFGTCSGEYAEIGWLMAVGETSFCEWERPPAGKQGLIWLYSTVAEKTPFSNIGKTVDIADSFVVLLR